MSGGALLSTGKPFTHQSESFHRFALAGNPNCGKTTLFNQLTGSREYVGNWPGVTVERKEGRIKNGSARLLDLPGIYSLSPYSPEEVVTRNCLLKEPVDLIVNIVDATNLERNLYLTTQLMELERPMVVALNMMDLLNKRGDRIHIQRLEQELGVPVVPVSASKGVGLERLLTVCSQATESGGKTGRPAIYSRGVEALVQSVSRELLPEQHMGGARWTAVKLLEEDRLTLSGLALSSSQRRKIQEIRGKLPITRLMDASMIIADQRYRYICALCGRVVQRSEKQGKPSPSDRIDRVVTHRILAIPLFLAFLLAIFFITFGPPGNFLRDLVAWLIQDRFGETLSLALDFAGASGWMHSLLVDGVVQGVGSVVSFAPQIMLLFTLLSLLEDSGYMARAAFVMDRPLRKIGLSGRAFVPMLMGFGCTVPAVLGTRTLENRKDKQLVILITPFLSCSAKMPVYALFAATFFPAHRPLVIFSIYLMGILMAALTALLFKNTILKGEPAPFVMEMPPYRMPTVKSLWLHVWERLKDFFVRAGTLILGATLIIWFLQSFDVRFSLTGSPEDSILAEIGSVIAPVFTLCGFGDWRASVSLLSGLVAKESVVSTMAVLFSGTGMTLSEVFRPLSAYSFLVFVLLYTPCVAALSAIRREMGSAKWTAITIFYQLTAAWFVSAFVFQIGTLCGHLFG